MGERRRVDPARELRRALGDVPARGPDAVGERTEEVDDPLDGIVDLLNRRCRPGSTHWGDCHLEHIDCAAGYLVRELRASRERVRNAYDQGYQEAVRSIRSDSDSRLRERVRQLEAAIRDHEYGIAADTPEERLDRNRRLWSLVSQEDDGAGQ